ncbi:HD domain-containing phosphohydrolase [Thermotoga sp. SG1]|uniref:HD domain-containing phosphohydrolase n=1 Tax=Thermotoga sp. SG1 TaxID=126739 RepID=UPI000C77C7E2|nr:HD domain-containing phosphohydrolase [Thermotoga sp. SG1]PLV56199.1 ABC transporter substrate-binding protein [Thermotoga sp. SG1]
MRGVAFFFLILSVFVFSQHLRIALDEDYAPFSFYDENGNFVGISIDFWKLFSEKTGIEVELVPAKWQLAQQMVLEKQVDAIDQIFKTPEREKLLSFSKPVFEMRSCVFFRKDLPVENFSDLSSYVVGALRGEGMVSTLLQKNPDVRFEFFDNYSSLMKALKEREISVFLGDDIVARYYLSKEELLSDFLTLHLETNNLYVAVLKENKSILEVINSGLSLVSEDEKNKIIRRYIPLVVVVPSWLMKVIFYGSVVFSVALGISVAFVYLLRRKVEEQTYQLKLKNEELEAQNEEIEALYQEVSANQEEIERLYSEIRELNERFRYSIKELSKLVFIEDTSKFASELAEIIRDLLEAKNVKVVLDDQTFGEANGETFEISHSKKSHGYVMIEGDLGEDEREVLRAFLNIVSAIHTYRELVRKEKKLHRDIVRTWVRALEYYDYYTKGHSEEVAYYAVEIGKMFNMDGKKLEKLYWAGLLHDIGKIYVPQIILNKTDKLNEREFDVIKIHPAKGYELVKEIDGFEDVALWIRHHHERWDGKGYPDGLKGEEIEFEARILCVSDSYQAMRSDRPYKKGKTVEEAIQELLRNAGRQFDPVIVEKFIEFLRKGGDLGTGHQG